MALYFREHKGSFEESMKSIREIETTSELGNVTIKGYGFDKRLNSETKIVLRNGAPIGFITEKC